MQRQNINNNISGTLDKWILGTNPYDDGFDGWAEDVVNAFTDTFYVDNEEWTVDGSHTSQCNRWMQQLYKRNLNDELHPWIEPHEAAMIIERAHRMWIKAK